jgi:hypothetical protein
MSTFDILLLPMGKCTDLKRYESMKIIIRGEVAQPSRERTTRSRWLRVSAVLAQFGSVDDLLDNRSAERC